MFPEGFDRGTISYMERSSREQGVVAEGIRKIYVICEHCGQRWEM